jgi:Flp pilus assembly secretin CpaC
MRKWTIAVLALTCASCATAAKKTEGDCFCASDPLATQNVTRLAMGTDKFVDLAFEPGRGGVFVGNPNVLAATVAKAGNRNQLVLQPLKPGATNVTAMDRTGDIKYQAQFQVSAVDLNDLSSQIHELLKDTPNASVKLLKDKVVIDGELLTIAQCGRIATIVGNASYSPYVLNLTRLSPQFFVELAARTQEEIRKQSPSVSARSVNGQIWLEGNVDTLDQANRAAKVASLMLPEILPADPLDQGAGDDLEKVPARRLPPRPLVQNFLTIGKQATPSP